MEYFQLDRTALVFRGWQLTPAQILCIGLKLINCGPQQENSHRR